MHGFRLVVTLAALFSGSILPLSTASAQDGTLVFLVRHAERADDGAMTGSEDPHLSEAGLRRAHDLATLLRDAGITHIHSTDYRRTRETAAPLVRELGLPVAIYDTGNLEAFAQLLTSTPGRHLVVGHSNTTPALATALGGNPHGGIESMEYDRLYLLRVGPQGVETILLRFGEPYDG